MSESGEEGDVDYRVIVGSSEEEGDQPFILKRVDDSGEESLSPPGIEFRAEMGAFQRIQLKGDFRASDERAYKRIEDALDGWPALKKSVDMDTIRSLPEKGIIIEHLNPIVLIAAIAYLRENKKLSPSKFGTFVTTYKTVTHGAKSEDLLRYIRYISRMI
jgi:hypothetical protein